MSETADKVKEIITEFTERTDFIKVNYHCRYCNCDVYNPTWEQFADKIIDCMNCNSDILMRGKWTGNGMAFMRNLYEKYPDNPRWLIIYKTFWSEDD